MNLYSSIRVERGLSEAAADRQPVAREDVLETPLGRIEVDASRASKPKPLTVSLRSLESPAGAAGQGSGGTRSRDEVGKGRADRPRRSRHSLREPPSLR